MPLSRSTFLSPDRSCLASLVEPSPGPSRSSGSSGSPFNADQQRFADRLDARQRSGPQQTIHDFWAIHKPDALRSKTVDFSEVEARHRRWVWHGKPPQGELAEQFHRAALNFRFNNESAHQTSKLRGNRQRVLAMENELHQARGRSH